MNNKRIAVFPGSFDPVTKGHYNLVTRAIPLFDEIIVGMGINTSKHYYFDTNKRLSLLNQAFENFNSVRVMAYEGLTVDFCKTHNASFILRGLRNGLDFEYEKNIAQMNTKLKDGIETVMLVTDSDLSPISSSIIRELIKNKTDVAQFLPPQTNI